MGADMKAIQLLTGEVYACDESGRGVFRLHDTLDWWVPIRRPAQTGTFGRFKEFRRYLTQELGIHVTRTATRYGW